jgi:hypothetical protein
VKQYFRNLWLWARGIRWLWTRDASRYALMPDSQGRRVIYVGLGGKTFDYDDLITYKPGWGPWKFMPVYLTTYALANVLGYGIVSYSRVLYERREQSRYAHVATRLLNWIFPGDKHGIFTGPRLFGSVNLRDAH